MAKVYELRQLGNALRALHGKVRKATTRALIKTVTRAERLAKRNTREVFKGTRDRPKKGLLMNAIFSGYETEGSGAKLRIADGFVAVRSRKGEEGTKPYGRIHEFGGPIRAKKAKHLWIPLFGPKTRFPGGYDFSDMTPKKFFDEKKSDPAGFHFWMVKAKTGGGYVAGVTYGAIAKPRAGGQKRVVAMPGKSVGRVSFQKTRVRLKTVPLFALKKSVEMPKRPYVGPAVDKEFPLFPQYVREELDGIDPGPGGGT